MNRVMRALALTVSVMALTAPVRAAFVMDRTVGTLGDGLGELQYPTEMVLVDETVYVTDWANNRVATFHLDGTAQGYFGETDIGWLKGPVAIQATGDRLYVLEMSAERISTFDLEGNFKGAIGEDLGLSKPRDIFIVQDKLYIADTDNDRVVIATLQGKRVGAFGGLKGPRGLGLAYERLVVAQPDADKVDELDLKTGYPSRSIGADGSMRGPRRVTQGGRFLFVSDHLNHRVLVFDKDNRFVEQLGTGLLRNPEGLMWVADRQELWVADAENDRLVVFRYAPGEQPQPRAEQPHTPPPTTPAPQPAAAQTEQLRQMQDALTTAMLEKQNAALTYKRAAEKTDRAALAWANHGLGSLDGAGYSTREAGTHFVLSAKDPAVVAVYETSGSVVLGVVPLSGGALFTQPLAGTADKLRFLDFNRDGLEDMVLDVITPAGKTRHFVSGAGANGALSPALSLPVKTAAYESTTFLEGPKLFEVRTVTGGGQQVMVYAYAEGRFQNEGTAATGEDADTGGENGP